MKVEKFQLTRVISKTYNSGCERRRNLGIYLFTYIYVSLVRVSFYGFGCSFYRNIRSKSWTYANEAVKILGGRAEVDESA